MLRTECATAASAAQIKTNGWSEMGKKQTRSEARERAFSLIFQIGTDADNTEFAIEQMLEEYPESVDNLQYIKTAVYGVGEKYGELTREISAHLPENRAITRLSKTVTAILLLAVYEMKYIDDVPGKVAINEAVELAKKYSEEDAAGFVNGVLGAVIEQ